MMSASSRHHYYYVPLLPPTPPRPPPPPPVEAAAAAATSGRGDLLILPVHARRIAAAAAAAAAAATASGDAVLTLVLAAPSTPDPPPPTHVTRYSTSNTTTDATPPTPQPPPQQSQPSRAASWASVHAAASDLYLAATSAAVRAGQPLLDVRVVFEAWCGYDPWVAPIEAEAAREDNDDGRSDGNPVLLVPPHVADDAESAPDAAAQLAAALNERRTRAGMPPFRVQALEVPSWTDGASADGHPLDATAPSDSRFFPVDPSAPPTLGRFYDTVALGGTFDHLHSGHKILLTVAAWLAGRRIICGVVDFVDPSRLQRKAHHQYMEPIAARLAAAADFLRTVRADLVLDVVPIVDDFGPTRDDPNIQAIVGSGETEKGCFAVNKLRKENGLNELDIYVVDVIAANSRVTATQDMGLKISSSGIRQLLAERNAA